MDYYPYTDKITKLFIFCFLFTSIILLNVYNNKKDIKEKSFTVGLAFSGISLALFLPYFLYEGVYSVVIGIILFLILFPLLSKKEIIYEYKAPPPDYYLGTCLKTNLYYTIYQDNSDLPFIQELVLNTLDPVYKYTLNYSQFEFQYWYKNRNNAIIDAYGDKSNNIMSLKPKDKIFLESVVSPSNNNGVENRYAFLNCTGFDIKIKSIKINNESININSKDSVFLANNIFFVDLNYIPADTFEIEME